MEQNTGVYEKSIRDAMLSDLGLSRNDELPMENFHDRKVTYDPGRRPSRNVTNVATAAWKAVGKQGIDDEEARSVQGLADLGGGRAHAAQHDAEHQSRQDRLQLIKDRPRPQQHAALTNISNFGGLERPGVPVKVFSPKPTATDATTAIKTPPHKRTKTQAAPQDTQQHPMSNTTQPAPSSKTISITVRQSNQTSQQTQPPELQSVQHQQSQSDSLSRTTEQRAGEGSVGLRNAYPTVIAQSSGKALWSWSSNCEAQMGDGKSVNKFDARVMLKMIDVGSGRQQAAFILHYMKPAGEENSYHDEFMLKSGETDKKEDRKVYIVQDMMAYKPDSGRHDANWCNVVFESGGKKKEITLFFIDSEVMNSFRNSAIALQASLSVSRLTPSERAGLQKRLATHNKAAPAEISDISSVPVTESDQGDINANHTREAESSVNTKNDAMGLESTTEVSTKVGKETTQDVDDTYKDKSVHDEPNVDKNSPQVLPEPSVTKYTPDALKSLSNTSPHVTPPLREWQYTESVLKNGRRIKTPKSLAAAKRASNNPVPNPSETSVTGPSETVVGSKHEAQSEIVVDFTAPSVARVKASTVSSGVNSEATQLAQPQVAFNFTSPRGAPTMPSSAAPDAEPGIQFNFASVPKLPVVSSSNNSQAHSKDQIDSASPRDGLAQPTTAEPKAQPEIGCSSPTKSEASALPIDITVTTKQNVSVVPQEDSALTNITNTSDQNPSNAELGQVWSMLAMMKSLKEIDVIEETTTVKTTRRYVLPVGTMLTDSSDGQATTSQSVPTGVVSDVEDKSNSATALSANAPVFQPTAGSTIPPTPAQDVFQTSAQGIQQRKGLANSKFAQSTEKFSHKGRFTGSLAE